MDPLTTKGLVLALLLLGPSGCSEKPPPAPDLVVNGVSVYYHGQPRADAEVAEVLLLLQAQGEALAESAGIHDFALTWMAEVDFAPDPFSCGGTPSYGCAWPGASTVEVGYREPLCQSALLWELGHLVWSRVYGNPGEVDGDGGITVDPAFQRWEDSLASACYSDTRTCDGGQ